MCRVDVTLQVDLQVVSDGRCVITGGRAGCEYGDMTPNCERVRQNPGLCYIPENRYLCCDTCSNIRVTENPGKMVTSLDPFTTFLWYLQLPRTQIDC